MTEQGSASVPPAEPAPPESDAHPEPVERLLDQVAPPSVLRAGGGGLRVARIVSVSGGAALIDWRGGAAPVGAMLAPGLEVALLEEVAEDGGMVLVEDGPPPLVVGVLQTRRPRELKLRAGTVTLEGEHEVMIRAGRAAIRLREDGDIEIVGSRISAASRGLFRLVGRILRLN